VHCESEGCIVWTIIELVGFVCDGKIPGNEWWKYLAYVGPHLFTSE